MYKNLRKCIEDLEENDMLLRISQEVDPYLEMAEIHKQVYQQGGPAILFENVKGSPFQAVSNVYGTFERTEYIFRKSLERVKKVTELKVDPTRLLKNPFRYISAPFTALNALPRRAYFSKPVLYQECSIADLPQITSWPDDGGAFITLPQVCTLPPGSRKAMDSNIGMYRIQLSGNDYIPNQEIGLHYQLHRGIGVHHSLYNESEADFKVSIFVGGPPSHSFSAIMPMPEGLSEMTFAGMLNNRSFRYFWQDGYLLSADADFCITGTVVKRDKKPEGPFGDHLGYYSLKHDFPYMKVDKVYHRKDPLWHFTVVGRPPAEDSSFGHLIHTLVEELGPQEFPGVKAIHAVDAAGVHPLLFAIGSERYMPFREKRPEEILTIANRILGSGQTSLAKYLFIAAHEDDPSLDIYNISGFFKHIFTRIDFSRDLHFQTQTTIDTLDYSGDGWNTGSKLIVACHGNPVRKLDSKIPQNFKNIDKIKTAHFYTDGILCIDVNNSFLDYKNAAIEIDELLSQIETVDTSSLGLIVLCDDASFSAENDNNFVWVTFTRSNPSHDVYGVGSHIQNKHWSCKGPILIDARKKPHHAPELIPDEKIEKKVSEFLKTQLKLRG